MSDIMAVSTVNIENLDNILQSYPLKLYNIYSFYFSE